MSESVLFVDDDTRILQGLKRMLHGSRNQWNMEFCSDPNEALKKMQSTCYDIVITDMRMPGMGGAELLEATRLSCPQSVRIVLSGQAELDTVLRALPNAHLYLSKPCDSQTLKQVIDRCCLLRRTLKHPELREFISQLRVLPSQQTVVEQLRNLLLQSTIDSEQVVNAVASDVGISSKLLQLANSAFFSAEPREIKSIPETVKYLGTQLLERLVLQLEIFAPTQKALSESDLAQLNTTAIVNAKQAAASVSGQSESEEAYTRGLLVNIGEIALAAFKPEVYQRYLAARSENTDLEAYQSELFGATATEVGEVLRTIWGLPV